MLKENKLQLKTLENGTVIPTIDGKLFCSGRDPLKEAQRWFDSIERSCAGQDEIVVLGLGAGFHILPLLKLNMKVSVFEVREELVSAWPLKDQVNFVDADYRTDAVIVEFRPAWNGLESKYNEVSRRMRGTQVQALQNQAEEKGMWILAQALEHSDIPESLDVSIKDIVEVIPIENQTEEARLWRALRELVQ